MLEVNTLAVFSDTNVSAETGKRMRLNSAMMSIGTFRHTMLARQPWGTLQYI